jgi:hypothetical protein
MHRLKNWLRIASSSCALTSALLVLVGVLLIPNVVLADQYIPNNAGVCSGCAGTCPSSPTPCTTVIPKTCTQTGNSCTQADNCKCDDIDGNGVCECGN